MMIHIDHEYAVWSLCFALGVLVGWLTKIPWLLALYREMKHIELVRQRDLALRRLEEKR